MKILIYVEYLEEIFPWDWYKYISASITTIHIQKVKDAYKRHLHDDLDIRIHLFKSLRQLDWCSIILNLVMLSKMVF